MKVGKTFFIATLVFFIAAARPREPLACDCSPYLAEFDQQMSLGADITDIGLRVLDPSEMSRPSREGVRCERDWVVLLGVADLVLMAAVVRTDVVAVMCTHAYHFCH
jgi:hypothetical protein